MTALEEMYRDLRPYAFAIAYRMLGSVSEAEDVVQDAFVRLSTANLEGVASPKAYLATVTTRLSIDALRSARVRRESYVGPWLPEPLLTDPAAGPADVVETADSLSMAFLVVLETLSPVERAVFLLHDVFAYEYADIAPIVGKSEANCRQLATRARRHVEAGKPRFETSRSQRTELAQRFLAACAGADLDGLVSLLAGDALFYGDGGEKGSGLKRAVHGGQNVARLVLGLTRRATLMGITMRPVEINGEPGAMFFDADGALISLIGIEIVGDRIQTIRGFVNPDKLGHLGTLSPLGRRDTSDDWA
ncbi:MAG TPA: RNA polymerase sigma-70 factor [Jatrophihabitantaceae bacterium]|jgi:RNA polymerase sigma-70 factor (ECF subfamily)